MITALVVALLGAIVLPGVAQILSLGIALGTPSSLLSEIGRRRRRWVVVANLLVIAVFAVLILTPPPYPPHKPAEAERQLLEHKEGRFGPFKW
jgi:hypothetical protein